MLPVFCVTVTKEILFYVSAQGFVIYYNKAVNIVNIRYKISYIST